MDIQRVLRVLQGVLPRDRGMIPLHEPRFDGNELAYVKQCIDTGWVSSLGSYVDRFEEGLAGYTGARRAVAVASGTAALHMGLLLAGVKPGDEVLVPALTFVATANAVSYCGAIPHFVDSEARTLGMSAGRLADHLGKIGELGKDGCCYNKVTDRPIRAAVPVHTFGHPVDLDGLLDVCTRFGIVVVEDATESLGSFYRDRHTGNHGRVSALSFNGNKILTTGGGGAILTNDEELGALAKHLTSTARVPHPWALAHDRIGYNYRMPNINAALGCAQLEQLPRFLRWKRNLAQRYADAFSGVEGLCFFAEPAGARSNYWLNVLLLDEEQAGVRDRLVELTNRNGIQTRPAWTLMHLLPMYAGCPRMDLSVAGDIARRLINVPSSAVLGRER